MTIALNQGFCIWRNRQRPASSLRKHGFAIDASTFSRTAQNREIWSQCDGRRCSLCARRGNHAHGWSKSSPPSTPENPHGGRRLDYWRSSVLAWATETRKCVDGRLQRSPTQHAFTLLINWDSPGSLVLLIARVFMTRTIQSHRARTSDNQVGAGYESCAVSLALY